MTTQPRRLLLRVAAVGALVSGAVLLPATAALARVEANPGSLTLNAGEEKQVTITLSQADRLTIPGATITIAVNGLGNDVTLRGPGGCNGNNGGLTCNENAFDEDGDEQKLTITVAAKNPGSLQPGQTREGSININGPTDDDSVNISLKGPAQAASASEVNGTVVDQATGDAVPGAQISLKDSAGNTHDATANNQGKYSIKSSQNKQIVPGQVTVTATKEGFADATATGTAQSGKVLALNLRMKPTTASAAPSAPVASETQPGESAAADPSGLAQPGKNTSGEDTGTSMLSWVLIGMGILLVLLGIGAIVLLVMRRKDDADDPDGYGNDPNQLQPVGAGAYAGGPAATMVGGRSNSNDQTAIVGPNQQLDEFPDPYAAPPPAPAPTRVGGAYSGGYNDPQATSVAPGYGRGGDYGNGGGYRDDRGYGESQRGGYGDDPRGGGYGGGGGYADQPTGHYQGGADQGGYPAAGGYPAGGANGSEYGANGYGGGGANGSAYGGGGGYGAGAQGGGANGYSGGAGYEDEYGRGAGGGYQGGAQGGGQAGGQQGGGYDQRGGDYAGDQRNGRNRSVDWLE